MNGSFSAVFSGAEHQPFHFDGGTTAALLVHGFPGTPAEMRPLAERLHAMGWTVRGLLLPGFGTEIDELLKKNRDDWSGAVRRALAELRKAYDTVVLVGYSFGGAVALNTAAPGLVDGLVLIAPFWRVGGRRMRWTWTVLKRIFPTIQPFRGLNFTSEDVRAGLGNMLPGLDLQDPAVQSELKNMRVPARFVDEIIELGLDGKARAAEISLPTLVIQGEDDEVVQAAITRELCAAFPQPPCRVMLSAGHDLLEAESPVLAAIAGQIREFAQVEQPVLLAEDTLPE